MKNEKQKLHTSCDFKTPAAKRGKLGSYEAEKPDEEVTGKINLKKYH